MPQSSHAIPLLAIYIDALMCLIGLSLLECFLMMNWLSKVGCSVPSPRMWYFVVDRWGDYMLLGSNGTYWRRNYLRILEEVNAKEAADTRRKAYERKKWSTTSRKHQENYIRKWSNFGAQTRKTSEIDALICLMNRWGYSFGNLNHIRRRYQQGPVMPDLPGNEQLTNKHRTKRNSFRHVDELDKYGPITATNIGNINPAGFADQPSSSRTKKRESEGGGAEAKVLLTENSRDEISTSRNSSRNSSKKRKSRKSKTSSSSTAHIANSLELLNADIETVGNVPIMMKPLNVPTSSSIPASTSPSFRHIDDDNSPRDENLADNSARVRRTSRFQRTTTLDKTGSIVNFNVETQQCETRLSTGGSNRRQPFQHERERSGSLHHSPLTQVGGVGGVGGVMQTDKQMQLTALDDIRQLIDDVNTSLSSHTLRRECIGVWTTFITVIDRFMSLILMLLCILMPTYL